MGELEPLFVLGLLALSFVGFVLTSAVGLGSAIFLVPLFMFRLPAAHAVALAAPITLVGNLSRGFLLREHLDRPALAIVGAGSVPAAVLAALYVVEVDPAYLKLAVGLLVLSSLVLDVVSPDALRIGKLGLGLIATASGVLSGLAGLAGPPGVIAMRAYGLTGPAFVATLSAWGVLLQTTKIPAYVVSGAMPASLLSLAVALSVLSALGAWVATRWLSAMRASTFRLLVNALLALVSLSLIADAF